MNTIAAYRCLASYCLFLTLFLKPFGAVAGIESARGATELIVAQLQVAPPPMSVSTSLPMRNLHIELRQQGIESSQRSSVDAQGRVILQSSNARGAVGVGVDQSRLNQGRNLQQQALVLNGRSVSFQLGQTVPLRIVQVFAVRGGISILPSTVLIERASGFNARPIWRGGDMAEVEVSTALAQGAQQTNTTTTLQIPVNEWITIAQTEDAQISSASGILSRSSEQVQSNLRVEMRVTVK